MTTPILEVAGLSKFFASGGGVTVRAVDDVSFEVGEGEFFGLVGESGSGKTAVAHCAVRLHEPSAGSIKLAGTDITHLRQRALRPLRNQMHMVFQNPYSSLNPRMTCGEIVEEPVRLHGAARGRAARALALDAAEKVGLRSELLDRLPHELSGGQRQRVGLARSLVLRPRLLIADEPVSALDVSIQASILNLLRDLHREMGFSCLFISHDLATVEYLCDRVAVMYLGQIVESGTTEDLFQRPQHPYTRALLDAALIPDPRIQRARPRLRLLGDIPSPADPPSGCRFRTRCPLEPESAPRSTEEQPELRLIAPGHRVACHLVNGESEPVGTHSGALR
jgi:oligopeptide transport system ATP-binding protein